MAKRIKLKPSSGWSIFGTSESESASSAWSIFGSEASTNTASEITVETATRHFGAVLRGRKKWLVFDTETTGIWRKHDNVAVCQVAAILFDGRGRELERYVSLVNPGRSIPREATEVHGITSRDVKNAPTANEVARALKALFKKASFVVAHNASFDARAADWLGLKHDEWVCTMGMTHRQVGGKWPTLMEAAEHVGIDVDEAKMHDAAYDAMLAAGIYMALRADGEEHHSGYWR